MTPSDPIPVPRAPLSPPGFGRLLGAYALSALLATVLLPVGLAARDLFVVGPQGLLEVLNLKGLLSIVTIGFVLIFVFAAPFATAFIALMEALGRRSLPIYAVAGAVIGPLVGLLAAMLPAVSAEPAAFAWGSLVLHALIGLASGALFWSLAFRRR